MSAKSRPIAADKRNALVTREQVVAVVAHLLEQHRRRYHPTLAEQWEDLREALARRLVFPVLDVIDRIAARP